MNKEKDKIMRIAELVIPAIVGFAFAWGAMTIKVAAVEDKVNYLSDKYDTILEIKGDISSIKTDIVWIKENLK